MRPTSAAADAAPPAVQRAAIDAVREEVRPRVARLRRQPRAHRTPGRAARGADPGRAVGALAGELGEIGAELRTFADVEQLFIASPGASISGELGPSNGARMRVFVRRLRAGGAGIAEEFLELVRTALAHYGITSLDPGDALERAVLRLLATQRSHGCATAWCSAVIRHATALARAGAELHGERGLAAALERIAAMRGLVPHAVADAAAEGDLRDLRGARRRAARGARTARELDAWISAAEAGAAAPPEAVLCELAEAPRAVFDRVGRWLAAPDPRRRAIALEAHLRRLYGPGAARRARVFDRRHRRVRSSRRSPTAARCGAASARRNASADLVLRSAAALP